MYVCIKDRNRLTRHKIQTVNTCIKDRDRLTKQEKRWPTKTLIVGMSYVTH